MPGIIVLGSTGEFLTVSDDERTQLVEATIRHINGRIPVLVGTMNALHPERGALQPRGRARSAPTA